ncbi:GTP-binding protein Era [endosymbiont of Acanthamoeba sp. UWC8]|uniref:GTPase Era n=1 Tax=endosymbiont of Acanthamoeba sp. UWC8 TaxID=86106 RepID=UPI0004D10376|nr:GTPase Era [endosymbiont of Acanthamoeba sp. UWC8]AIF80804.1 GTP-binding protein Era [endosymbiont of Acanthamoeba sp. UWC8]
MSDKITKCLKVGLIGEPNAGKSTLINQLIGEKISIVSPKVQTTRTLTRGILNVESTQLVFIDTPGIFKPSKTLEKYIVNNARAGIDESDLICVLIDAKRGLTPELNRIIVSIKDKPLIAVINKVDLIKKDLLLKLAEDINGLNIFKEIFMISALKNDGVKDVVNHLVSQAPNSPWYYEEDLYTDTPSRSLAEEITREQLFLLLNRELPYSLKVETEKWEDQKDGSLKLHQAIVVLRSTHKNIVVGAGGQKIKEVGRRARLELQKILERKVHLFLYVKVREDWVDKELG